MNVLVSCTQNIMTQAELYHLISAGHPELCKWETFIQIQFIFVLIKKKTLKKPVSQTLEVFWRKEVTVPGGEQCQIMTWKNLCLLISEASSSPAPSLIAGFFCSSWNSESNGRESIQQHTSSTVHSGLSVSTWEDHEKSCPWRIHIHLTGGQPFEWGTRTQERGSEGSARHRWRCCQTPLLHHHRGKATEKEHTSYYSVPSVVILQCT